MALVAGLGIVAVGIIAFNMMARPRQSGPAPTTTTSRPAPMAQPVAPIGGPEALPQPEAPTLKWVGHLELLGTWLADDERGALALLHEQTSGKRAFIRTGDRFGTWQVTSIERGLVRFLEDDGGIGELKLDAARLAAGMADQPAPTLYTGLAELQQHAEMPAPEQLREAAEGITVISEQDRVVDRKKVFEGTDHTWLMQARFVPELEGTSLSGLRVAALADSPLTQKWGLRAGDVILSINGKPILDPSALRAIQGDFARAQSLDLNVRRNGQEMTLRYQMVN